MDAKKSGLLSRFTLQIATAFFLFISVLLLTASFQGRVIFQGFNHVGVVNSSASIVSSWPFTFPAKPNSSANAFGVALGKVNSDRNGSLGSVRQNAPEGGRESNGSLPVAGIADAGEQNTTTSKEADRSNNGYVKQSIEDSYQNCDIFDGRWERDESKPYYPAGSCPHIDRDFDCHANGRPDSGFVKWRWQPNRCDVPRLNATDFLERLRGKKLVFVGDSLNRNMWESLDYNCTVDFVGSPFLVRESLFSSANGTVDTLRLDLMDKTTSMYHDADIIVFNTGHWWTHEKTSKGENYYQEGDYVHKRLKVLEAYKRALKTWGRWVDRSIDTNRTHVFFRGYSVTHFKGGQWNSGGKCHKETEPIFNTTHLAKYPSKMKVLENVLHEMKTPVAYLNISRLTDHRKDGHPSIYRKKYDTPEELLAAERSQDCSHWCLPGVPDTWNELLYASMLKAGIGS
ncbi:Protein trichome birefringence-like 2 [Linum perenne]